MIALLVLLAGVISLQRLHTYDEPADWDVGCYAVIGHELNLCGSLYRDVWDIKPPGIFWTYALAERLAGYGDGEVYMLAVVSSIATMLGVWWAGASAGMTAGLVAAAAFTVVGGDMGLDANRPNTEAFINAGVAWAIALLVNWKHRRSWLRALALGALLGATTLYKQVAVAPAGLLVLAHVLSPPRSVTRLAALGHAACAIATIGIIWLLVALAFSLTGRSEIFWHTMVTYPRYYSGGVGAALLASLHPSRLAPMLLYPLLPCAVLSLAMLLAPPPRRRWIILLAAVVGAQIAIALPNHEYAHYYQLWLVPATIGAGWGAAALLELEALRRRAWLAPGAIATVLILLCVVQIPDYFLSAAKWSEVNDGPYHAATYCVGAELDRTLPPGQTFLNWTNEQWLYYAARRRPPIAAISRDHAVRGPLAQRLSASGIERLRRNPPAMVVTWEFNSPIPGHPIDEWIAANYRRVDDGVARWPLVLLKRKTVDLPRKVAQPGEGEAGETPAEPDLPGLAPDFGSPRGSPSRHHSY